MRGDHRGRPTDQGAEHPTERGETCARQKSDQARIAEVTSPELAPPECTDERAQTSDEQQRRGRENPPAHQRREAFPRRDVLHAARGEHGGNRPRQEHHAEEERRRTARDRASAENAAEQDQPRAQHAEGARELEHVAPAPVAELVERRAFETRGRTLPSGGEGQEREQESDARRAEPRDRRPRNGQALAGRRLAGQEPSVAHCQRDTCSEQDQPSLERPMVDDRYVVC